MKFTPLKVLKKYGFTELVLGRDLERGIFILQKRLVLNQSFYKQLFLNEINCLKSLNHRYIVKLVDVDFNENAFYIEYSFEGDIKQNLLKIENSKKIIYLKQILEALEFLHLNNYVHNDLTLSNILLFKSERIKLSDFAFCGKHGEEIFSNSPDFFLIGTDGYRPDNFVPNQFRNDIYAFGKIFYCFLTGKTNPFFEKENLPSQKYNDFIEKCLNDGFQTISQVKEELSKLTSGFVSLL